MVVLKDKKQIEKKDLRSKKNLKPCGNSDALYLKTGIKKRHTAIFSRMLRFLSKVAFISNLFLIPVLLIHHVPSFARWDAGLISHMVITTYFIALPLNLLVNAWLLVLLMQKKKPGIPAWLQIANLLFLGLQVYYFQFT